MLDEIKVQVKAKHFKEDAFHSNTNCAIAQALKGDYPEKNVIVGVACIVLDKVIYTMDAYLPDMYVADKSHAVGQADDIVIRTVIGVKREENNY